MSQYYLMSQLPSLDGLGDSMPVPITEERFYELCTRFLSKKALNELNKLTLVPPRKREKSTSSLVEAWNEGERALRLALGKIRAEKMKKSFYTENDSINIALMQTVRTAIQFQDPLEAEKFLNRYRLDFLESLRPMDAFSEDMVFYYGLKLKLILRIRQFNENIGETAYRNIYSSIIHGERSEATQ